MQKAERLIYLALIAGLLVGLITVAGLGAAVWVGWGGANHRAKQWEESAVSWKKTAKEYGKLIDTYIANSETK